MIIKRFFSWILIILLTVALLPANAAAQTEPSSGNVPTLQILEKMELRFYDSCSGHDYFYHVAVREDGWFAVLYRTAINKVNDDEYLSRIYVDIFNAQGEFQKEISFKSEYNIALELGDTLRIYDADFVISYDWISGSLEIERTPRDYARSSGIYEDFIQKKFDLGGWSYRCERTLMGYCTIVRTNGEQKETLLSLSGNIPEMNVSLESRVALVGVSVLLLGFAGVCVCAIYLKRKNNRKQ